MSDVIDRYFEADSRRDTDAIVDLFTDDAVVFDEDKTWRGPEGIRAWREGPASTYEYTATVLATTITGEGDSYLVSVRLDGNFPGGTVDLRFSFALAGDRIGSLHIEP